MLRNSRASALSAAMPPVETIGGGGGGGDQKGTGGEGPKGRKWSPLEHALTSKAVGDVGGGAGAETKAAANKTDYPNFVSDPKPPPYYISWSTTLGVGAGAHLKPISPMEKRVRLLRFCQKAIYLVALVVLVLLLLVQSFRLVRVYLGVPTYLSSAIVKQREADFPALTMCPDRSPYGGYKEDVMQEHGIPTIKNYNYWKNQVQWSSNQSGVSEKELFHKVTFNVDELFAYLYIRFFKEKDGKFNTSPPLKNTTKSLQEQRHRAFGRCYTLRPEKWITDQGIYYMKMKFHTTVKLYLHSYNQFLDLNGRMGFWVRPGDSLRAQVNYEEIRMLSRRDDDDNLLCTNELYDKCMYGALEHHMIKEVGCVAPWVFSSKAPVCTEPSKVNTSFWIAYNRVTNQKDDCHVPCQALIASLGGINRDRKNSTQGELYLYFGPRIMLSKEQHFYTFLSLMAEIGGYVGLLLGVSIFHFAGWIASVIEKKIAKIQVEESLKMERKANFH